MSASLTETLEGLPPAILEELKRSAERSQLRQLRRLQQLQKQAVYLQDRDIAWRQKEKESHQREQRKQQEFEAEARERALRRAKANERREQNQNQAEKRRLENLMRLQHKLDNARRRSECMKTQRQRLWALERSQSRGRQIKRDIVKEHNAHILEEKRTALFNKQEEVERKLTERNQLLEEERRLLNYQKHLTEIERQKEALSKATQQEEERRQHFIAKQQKKERSLEFIQREKEIAALAKAEKARIYQYNVKERLNQKKEQHAMLRERQDMAFQDKISRAARVEKQRDMVRDALSSVRRAMMRQEEEFRKQLEKAKFVSFDDYDLAHTSTLISSLKALSRPRTARGRLESPHAIEGNPSVTSSVSDDLYLETNNYDEDIHVRAKELTNDIDQELMREMERKGHLTLAHAEAGTE